VDFSEEIFVLAVENNHWEAIKHQLHDKLTPEAFQNWIARTSLLAHEGSALRVMVPDDVTRLWLEHEYAPRVQTAIKELNLPVARVHYEVARNGGVTAASEPRAVREVNPPARFEPAERQLNHRLGFDSFVVGSCNQFAHAAATAVAAQPAKVYNPLFIYGGSGMGKTHLLHAIGVDLLARYPDLRLVYTSGERFVNETVSSIRTQRMDDFHAHYRTADVLLVDDIHILAGKERTQEEFFHTFNELYDHQKQIVITCDSLPRQIPGLVDRLRSRFEWGLMVDVQPPDLETKMAILDQKARQEGIFLPEDVRIYLATKTRSNVRELEGAWVKLLAFSSVTESPITLGMAQQALKPILPSQERRISIDSVVRAVAERFSLQPSQLKQKTNSHNISRPRQIAMYLAKELTGASLPELGRAFGGKHHTTVLHSIRKVEQARAEDPDVNRIIHSLMDSFN
jgi:chromosomal replication initiator protein